VAPKSGAGSSIEDAIGRALHLHRTGKNKDAEQAYRAVLLRAPRHPHALHFYGMWLHERGRTREAIERLERALEAAPGDAQIENNLAGLYLLVERSADAERLFTEIVTRTPDSVPSRFNLGVLYARSGRWAEAVTQLEAVRALVVDFDVLAELGEALLHVSRFEDAVAAHREAFALAPTDADQKRRLSHAYFKLADDFDRKHVDPARALAHLRDWVAIDPDDALARHTLAAYSGRDVPERCSDEYVRRTFDLFAPSFDKVLHELKYVGVERSAAALDAVLGPTAAEPTAVLLDAGCGTGALGPLVRARCARLVGVDLSPKMVEAARARGVYDQVELAELTSWLATRGDTFDAIVCADTVVYVGDVEPLFRGSIRALVPGGVFVITVEALITTDAAATFRLDRHGRYSHALPYLRATLEAAGAEVMSVEELPAIRVEYGADVPGTIVVARRRPISA
jgi:predicted TPR repeat methyltransferase